MQETQRAVTLVRESSPNVLGPLRLGYTALADLRWLTSVIGDSRLDHNLGTKLDFVSYEVAPLHDELIKGTLHAALVFGCLHHPDVHCETLFQEPLCAVVGRRHPLAGREWVRLRELEEEPVIWLRHDLYPAQQASFRAVCGRHSYSANIGQEVTTFFECIEFARAGLGLTFVPAFLQQDRSSDDVAFLRLHEEDLAAEYSLAYRHNRRSENVDHLLNFITKHARTRMRDNRTVQI